MSLDYGLRKMSILNRNSGIEQDQVPFFTKSEEKQCEDVKVALSEKERAEVSFKSGSRYSGKWNALGMAGEGTYKMFHNVDYVGRLGDGMFEGYGMIWYPNCSRVEGIWRKGCIRNKKYYYDDGLLFHEKDWEYCCKRDRRFLDEIKYGLKGVGQTMKTAKIPTRKIPPGCYDTGDGFYNPVTKCIVNPFNYELLRIPRKSEEQWILENCTKSPGEANYEFSKMTTITQCFDKLEKVEEVKTVLSPEKSEVFEGEEGLKSVDHCVGRYDLVVKVVGNRFYKYKYVIIDERKEQCPKASRLMLPVFQEHGKQKISIAPNICIASPQGCTHESKCVIANKLLLLIKVLKASEHAGGPQKMSSSTLKKFEDEYRRILEQEGQEESSSESLPSLELEPYKIPHKLQKVMSDDVVREGEMEETVAEFEAQKEEEYSKTSEGSEVSECIEAEIPDKKPRTIAEELEILGTDQQNLKLRKTLEEADKFKDNVLIQTRRRTMEVKKLKSVVEGMTEKQHMDLLESKMDDLSKLSDLMDKLPSLQDIGTRKTEISFSESESINTKSVSDIEIDLLADMEDVQNDDKNKMADSETEIS